MYSSRLYKPDINQNGKFENYGNFLSIENIYKIRKCFIIH